MCVKKEDSRPKIVFVLLLLLQKAKTDGQGIPGGCIFTRRGFPITNSFGFCFAILILGCWGWARLWAGLG